MPAITACGSTLYAGETPAEVLGVQSWALRKELKSTEYADNTTGCGTSDTRGNITEMVDIIYNLQDGASYGKPVWDVGEIVDMQLHVDDSGSNYYTVEVRIMSLDGNEFNHESPDPVKINYTAKVQGSSVGAGTLADS